METSYDYYLRSEESHTLEEALENINTAIELDPSIPMYIGARGDTYYFADKYEDAIRDFTQYVGEMLDEIRKTLRKLITCHSSLDHTDYVLNILEQLHRLGLSDERDYVSVGRIHYDLHLYKEALEDFTRAHLCAPTKAFILLWRARIYFETGDYENTITDVKQASECPDGSDYENETMIHLLRGKAYFKLGKTDKARNEFKKLAQIDGLEPFDDMTNYHDYSSPVYQNATYLTHSVIDLQELIMYLEQNGFQITPITPDSFQVTFYSENSAVLDKCTFTHQFLDYRDILFPDKLFKVIETNSDRTLFTISFSVRAVPCVIEIWKVILEKYSGYMYVWSTLSGQEDLFTYDRLDEIFGLYPRLKITNHKFCKSPNNM